MELEEQKKLKERQKKEGYTRVEQMAKDIENENQRQRIHKQMSKNASKDDIKTQLAEMQKAVLKTQAVADMTQQLRKGRQRTDRNLMQSSFRMNQSSRNGSFQSSYRSGFNSLSPEKKYMIKEEPISFVPKLTKEMHGQNIMISEPRSMVVSTMQPNLSNRILVRKSRNLIEKDNSTKINNSRSMATLHPE